MKTYKIFTSGKMGGLSYEEQMKWRSQLEYLIRQQTNEKVTFIHPPDYFDYNFPDQKTAKEWEINQVIDSDIVVVDFGSIKDSIGTHMELGVIHAINRIGNKHIATVGIGRPDTNHPWIQSSVFYQVVDVKEAADFICKYLLI